MRQTFVDYLSSPVVSLMVGGPGEERVLTAHQALLVKSPYFKDVCATFADDGSVRPLTSPQSHMDSVDYPSSLAVLSNSPVPCVDVLVTLTRHDSPATSTSQRKTSTASAAS